MAEIIEKAISTKRRAELLAELAEGVTLQETLKNGETKIYTRAPSVEAIKELNDRQYGKSRQSIEHSGEDGGPIGFKEVRESFVGRIASIVARSGEADTTQESHG